MILSNLHTHTIFCDGKNSPEEFVKEAIKKGFDSIGFSSHSYTSFDNSFCMSKESTSEYIKEIFRLKEQYRKKINIYLGCERDYFSDKDDFEYDYIIGSLHYVKAEGNYLSVDESEEVMCDNVDKYFDGDYLKYVKCYYDTIRDIASKTKCDIIGHLDVVAKFNEGNKYFNETSHEYINYARQAIDKIKKHCNLFEVNTGAVYKGYRKEIYPERHLLKILYDNGCKVILSSDCHDISSLDFGFKDAIKIIKECGYNEITVMKDGKFESVKIL